jgi:hypothetical protein
MGDEWTALRPAGRRVTRPWAGGQVSEADEPRCLSTSAARGELGSGKGTAN